MAKISVVRLMPVMDYGGVEIIVCVLAERLPRDLVDFRVVTFDGDGAAAARVREAGVVCDVLGKSPALRNPGATVALANYIRRCRPDIVHASIAEANFHASLACRAVPRTKLLLEEVGTPSRSKKAQALFGAVNRRADAWIGVSQATCDYLISRERARAPDVHLIYNCVADEFFEPLKRNRSKTLRVTILGRLVPVKNHAMFLRVWDRFADSRDGSVALNIAGAGAEEQTLREQVADMAHGATVNFCGYIHDVRSLLAQTDLLVLPSLREGYGIALVEAMAVGIPVIGSTAGGIPEVLDGYPPEWQVGSTDEAGWLHALQRFALLSTAERRVLGRLGEGLSRARFSSETYIESIVALYTKLAKR